MYKALFIDASTREIGNIHAFLDALPPFFIIFHINKRIDSENRLTDNNNAEQSGQKLCKRCSYMETRFTNINFQDIVHIGELRETTEVSFFLNCSG